MSPARPPLRVAAGLRLVLALVLSAPASAAPQRGEEAPVGRYVRVELPGPGRILSLAEVEVVRAGDNVALRGAARQSATEHGGDAGRAIDGDRDGVFTNGSVTHTPAEDAPWWEVDLVRSGPVEQVTVWNRTDCCGERLEGLRVAVLDEAREVVWETSGGAVPRPRRDYVLGGARAVDLGPSPAARARRQEAIGLAIDRGVEHLIEVQQADGSWGHATAEWGAGATGLVLYTLLKQGVARDHQALRRGFAYLRGARPAKTYSLACVLLALAALDDDADLPRLEALTELLLEWQSSTGDDGEVREMWAYPESIGDLSNTQYAALALRAAAERGVRIPKDAWTGMLAAVLDHRGEEVDAPDLPRGEESRSGPPRAAGFRYRALPQHAVTGSMTTAGLSVLAIAREGLDGKVPGRWRRDAYQAEVTGLNWLAANFSADQNPGAGGAWHDYYLYGVERVGALFDVERFGAHDWYWEGARSFLARQRDGGEWGALPDTCFALLFLSRATSATTGAPREQRADTWIAEGLDDEVRWRVLGNGDAVTMFVTGFSEARVVEASFDEGPVRGLRVVEVRYYVDDEEVARIPADPGVAWNQERFPTRHRFERPGGARARCEVTVLDPRGAGGTTTRVLHGRALDVVARRGWAAWMDEAARATAANLLRDASVQASASSHNADGQEPSRALDSNLETGWVCRPGEEAPELTLDLDRPVRGDVLLLYGLARHDRELDGFDRARRYEVWLDRDREPRLVDAPLDPLQPARLELERPESIRRIRVRIAERDEGRAWRGQAGLREVAVLLGG